VIPYAIERGRRLKTVAIGVDPVDGVRVRAWRHAHHQARRHRLSQSALDSRTASAATKTFRRPQPARVRERRDVPDLGRQYRLKLERSGDANARVRIAEDRLIVPVTTKGPWPLRAVQPVLDERQDHLPDSAMRAAGAPLRPLLDTALHFFGSFIWSWW
jgi:hypothetical protein